MKNILLISLFLFILLAACAPSAAVPDVSQNGIEIYQARVPIPGGMSSDENMDMPMGINLAAFMNIKNTSSTNDRLLSVSVDFAEAQIHETRMDGDLMQMFEVPGIDIPAGQGIELKPGSFHIMLINPMKNLMIGDTVNLTLDFENAGTIMVPAQVIER